MKTAKLIKRLDGFNGSAALYKLSKPMPLMDWDDNIIGSCEYVICSTVIVPFSGVETYIFQSNKDGVVVSWSGLSGSTRGSDSHSEVLRNSGYETI